MLPIEERFFSSNYKPHTPPMSIWMLTISKLQKRLNIARDRLEQRKAARESMPS
jgi:hypothetical protein